MCLMIPVLVKKIHFVFVLELKLCHRVRRIMICTAYELFTNHECITCQLHCLRLLSGWLAAGGFNPVCLEFLFLVHILLILFSHFIVKSFYLTVYYKLFICWLAWWTSIILSYPLREEKEKKKKCICCKFSERRIWRSRVIFYYHVINLFFTFQSFAHFVLLLLQKPNRNYQFLW